MPKLCYSWQSWCPGCGCPGESRTTRHTGIYPTKPTVDLLLFGGGDDAPSVVYYLGRVCRCCETTWRVRDPNCRV